MPAKDVKFGSEARDRMMNGATVLAAAVKATLGPKGRNVLIYKDMIKTQAMIAPIPEEKTSAPEHPPM